MYDEHGKRKNSISIDGVIYVLSPEKEIERINKEHQEEKVLLNSKIKEHEQEIANLKKELSFANATVAYYKKVSEQLRTEKDKDLHFRVKMNFVDPPFRGDPGYTENIEEEFNSFEECIRFIDKKVYDLMDKSHTHTFSYCDISIEPYFTGIAYGRDVDIEETDFTIEFQVEADCRIKERNWASIIQHGEDISVHE